MVDRKKKSHLSIKNSERAKDIDLQQLLTHDLILFGMRRLIGFYKLLGPNGNSNYRALIK